jgi:signal transduction histidine kinase
LRRLLLQYLGALGGLTLLSVAAGWLLAGRALRPLSQITRTAQRVSRERLHERIDLRGPEDELKELADTIDDMLGRLDEAFAAQRAFVANASHELRSPLATMRAEIDVTLANPRATADTYRRSAEAIREEIALSERLVEGLLALTRASAGSMPREPVALDELAGAALERRAHEAKAKQIEVRAKLRPATVSGSPALLERLLDNLVENAIRHNHSGGRIELSTASRGDRATVRVLNGGAQVAAEDVRSLVAPFRRGAAPRTGEGFGLGLSIVDTVARAHGGKLALSAPSAGGLEVVVDLPAAGPPTGAPPFS